MTTPTRAFEGGVLWLDQAGVRPTFAIPRRRKQRRVRAADADIMSVLARAVRDVEAAVERGRVTAAVRTKFQVIALLVREEHARVQTAETSARPSGPNG